MKRLLPLILLGLTGCVAAAGHGVVYCRLLTDEHAAALSLTLPDGTRFQFGGDSVTSPQTGAVIENVTAGVVKGLKP